MAARHWLTVVGGLTTGLGGIAMLLPEVPDWLPFLVIAAGTLIAGIGGVDLIRERQRRLSLAQRDAIATAINANDGIDQEVRLRFAQGCDECRRYAEDIAKTLRLIGWHRDIGWSLDEQQGAHGLHLSVKNPQHPSPKARAIAAGLLAAKIDFQWAQNIHMADNQVAIWVYPKS